jgi:metallophosphoesterase superfamily enzyme
MEKTLAVLSDIHLEFAPHFALGDPIATWLALVGDLGYPGSPQYSSLLKQAAQTYEQVFVVAGNHEFYNTR